MPRRTSVQLNRFCIARDACVAGLLSGIFLFGLSLVAPRSAATAVALLGIGFVIASAILRSLLGLHSQAHSLHIEAEGAATTAKEIAAKAAELSKWPKIAS
jgi:hypothetical protein